MNEQYSLMKTLKDGQFYANKTQFSIVNTPSKHQYAVGILEFNGRVWFGAKRAFLTSLLSEPVYF